MSQEITDAIYETFGLAFNDNDTTEIDCYLYLADLKNDCQKVEELSKQARKVLETKDVCPNCGHPLSYEEYNEIHNELPYNNKEHCIEKVCYYCKDNKEHV